MTARSPGWSRLTAVSSPSATASPARSNTSGHYGRHPDECAEDADPADFNYPPDTEARLRDEAERQAWALADAATADELQQWWREQEHYDGKPADDKNLLLVRACYALSLCPRIGRELGAAAKIELDRANAERARATVAAVHGLDPEALDVATARKLMEEAERHVDALHEAARKSGTSAAKSAATRAERQRDRLEKYLWVACLARWDDEEYCLVYADDEVLKAS